MPLLYICSWHHWGGGSAFSARGREDTYLLYLYLTYTLPYLTLPEVLYSTLFSPLPLLPHPTHSFISILQEEKKKRKKRKKRKKMMRVFLFLFFLFLTPLGYTCIPTYLGNLHTFSAFKYLYIPTYPRYFVTVTVYNRFFLCVCAICIYTMYTLP